MPAVYIPALLQRADRREAAGGGGRRTVREVIENLERRCPGIREQLMDGDRLRTNIQVAVDGEVCPMGLREPTQPESEVHFVAAIRGG